MGGSPGMGGGLGWLGETFYGWGEKREVSYSRGCMDIYWGTNTTLRVMGVLPDLQHWRYIYIHT